MPRTAAGQYKPPNESHNRVQCAEDGRKPRRRPNERSFPKMPSAEPSSILDRGTQGFAPRAEKQLTSSEETRMATYFTLSDFILVIPMAFAGALFLGACPTSSPFLHNVLRVIGALLGVAFAVVL